MAGLGNFCQHLWKVYYPEFERPAGFESQEPKPPSPLASKESIEKGEEDLQEDDVKQVGVAIAEATYYVTGWSWYLVMIVLWIAYFIFALDNQVFPTMVNTIPGSVLPGSNASTGYTAYTTQSLFSAISKLVIAKIADIFGRFTALCITVFCYVLGFLIMAVSQKPADYTGGTVFYGIGNSGLQMVIWIVIADFVSARFRVLALGYVVLPIFITFVVGSKVLDGLMTSNWRWLPGMFCILVPVVLVPLMIILWYLEHKARRNNMVPVHPYLRKGFFRACWQLFLDADLVGLLLLVGGFAMIVVPLIRAGMYLTTYSTSWVIACLTVGPIILLIILPLYETFLSPRPFFRRTWLNSDIVIAMVIAFLDNTVFTASFQVAYNWIRVTYGFGLDQVGDANYFTNADNLSLTFFGFLVGLVIAYTRRFKYFLVAGCCLRLLGYGLMVRYRHVGTSMVQAVWPQIIQGMGGAFMGEILTLSAQITVRHQDVSMVTAVVLTLFTLGNSVGLAVYQSIITDRLPKMLVKYAPFLTPSQLSSFALLPTSAFDKFPHGTPEGTAISTAYNEASKDVLYCCMAVSAFLILVSLFVRDWYLPRSHNVVSNELPEKGVVADPTYEEDMETVKRSAR
ncbi:hypothetical protein MEQU1_002811 [Malassezia equina]|uniref:Major facilitator superfamily (MFS) profile domain-containing protein n=1 Tax=Malassezia equina TaxID=1381935 RepID=A0AAF0IZM1_9BASI|nr:hypothetical protein MEQU1_002811 [Malassezia equina]